MFKEVKVGVAYTIRRYPLLHGGYNSVYRHDTRSEAYFSTEEEAEAYFEKREFESRVATEADGASPPDDNGGDT